MLLEFPGCGFTYPVAYPDGKNRFACHFGTEKSVLES